MLRDLVAAFDQSRDQQVLGVRVAENHARPVLLRNHAVSVPFLFIRYGRRFPNLRFRFLWRRLVHAPHGEVGIVYAPAPRWPLMHLLAEPPPSPRSGDAGQRKYGPVVAVDGNFVVVAVGNRARAVHQPRSQHRSDDFHLLAAARCHSLRHPQRKRQPRSVGRRQQQSAVLHESLQTGHALPSEPRAYVVRRIVLARFGVSGVFFHGSGFPHAVGIPFTTALALEKNPTGGNKITSYFAFKSPAFAITWVLT